MKKQLPIPVIVLAAVACLGLVVVLFMVSGGEEAPTVAAGDRPNYAKMSPDQVSQAYADSKQAEHDAMKDVGGRKSEAASSQAQQRDQQGMGSTNDYYNAMKRGGSGGGR